MKAKSLSKQDKGGAYGVLMQVLNSNRSDNNVIPGARRAGDFLCDGP